jgi:hypothetical protein
MVSPELAESSAFEWLAIGAMTNRPTASEAMPRIMPAVAAR